MLKTRQSIGGLGNLMFKQAYLYAEMRDGVIPDVYVQDEKYFAEYKDEIKKMFGVGIGCTDMVSLQIRRGDYLERPDFYVNLSETDYYQEAVKLFPEGKFLVFCYDGQDPNQDKSDREWCKEYLDKLIPGRWEFHEPQGETDDLNKMASCKAHIGANSSFGWWGSYLGKGKVIMPSVKNWYTDGIERVGCPQEWTRI